MPDTHPAAIAPAPPRPLIGWRLLALFYDLWPSLALWMLASLCFTLGYTIAGHHDPHENIAPLSGLQWLLWITCWLLAVLYSVDRNSVVWGTSVSVRVDSCGRRRLTNKKHYVTSFLS